MAIKAEDTLPSPSVTVRCLPGRVIKAHAEESTDISASEPVLFASGSGLRFTQSERQGRSQSSKKRVLNMPVVIEDRKPVAFDASSVLYYLPKIAAAVANDPHLFPWARVGGVNMTQAQWKQGVRGYADAHDRDYHSGERITVRMTKSDEKRGVYNTPFLLQQKTELARDLANGTHADPKAGPEKAILVMRGFLEWLDRSEFSYVSSANAPGRTPHISESKMERQTVLFDSAGGLELAYNLFASVKTPVGNCLNAASALAFLFLVNRINPHAMQLVYLCASRDPADRADRIVFKGEKLFRKNGGTIVSEAPQNRQSTAVCKVTVTGGHVHSSIASVTELDQPFSNHWVVLFSGTYYDPLYRAVYKSPDLAFDKAKCLEFNPIPLREGQQADSVKWAAKTNRHLFVRLESPFVSRGAGLPEKCLYLAEALPSSSASRNSFSISSKVQQKGDSVTLHNRWAGGEDATGSNGLELPLEVGRVFGFCVPDDSPLMRARLMKAILRYEASANRFWRNVSDQSRDFCKRSRKWCRKVGDAPMDNKIYQTMSAREREGEWNGVATWGSKEEAREAIERAMAVGYRGPSTVGTTLCATLCDAFEVPGFWRR